MAKAAEYGFTIEVQGVQHEKYIKFFHNDDLNNLRLSNDQIELRTPETMKNIVEQGIAHQYSLYNMKNIFWKYP